MVGRKHKQVGLPNQNMIKKIDKKIVNQFIKSQPVWTPKPQEESWEKEFEIKKTKQSVCKHEWIYTECLHKFCPKCDYSE